MDPKQLGRAVEALLGAMEDRCRAAALTALAEAAALPKKSMPPLLEDDGFLSTAAAAQYAGCCTKTIRAWVAKGKVTRYLVGRHYRIKRSEIDAALAASEATPFNAASRARDLLVASRRRTVG